MDLIEDGNLGLVRAVERFDPDRGPRFSMCATWWVEHAIRRALYTSVMAIDEREARIVSLRFGLQEGQARTLSEIGRIVGLSR